MPVQVLSDVPYSERILQWAAHTFDSGGVVSVAEAFPTFHLSLARSRYGFDELTASSREDSEVPDKQPIEVRPDSGQWVVARQGSSRALSKHPTQKEAEPVGRDRARKDKVEFILKGRDGQIRKKDSYGSDPRRSKG